MKKNIFIGDLSKQTGVPTKTIRYYEDFGLLKKPKRTNSKYRLYTQEDVEKLLFIKKAKNLGLKLFEIKKIISSSRRGLEPCCCVVRELFTQKIKEYEANIKELTKAKNQLKDKLGKWIEPKQAKKMKYAICPQIEKDERRKRK